MTLDKNKIAERQRELERIYADIISKIQSLIAIANTSQESAARYEQLGISTFLQDLDTRINEIKGGSPGVDDLSNNDYQKILDTFKKLSESFVSTSSFILNGSTAFIKDSYKITINLNDLRKNVEETLQNTKFLSLKAKDLRESRATTSQIHEALQRISEIERKVNATTETYIAGVAQKVVNETKQDSETEEKIVIPAKGSRETEARIYKRTSWAWLLLASLIVFITFYTLSAFYSNRSITFLGIAFYIPSLVQEGTDAIVYASLIREISYKIFALTLLTSLIFFSLKQYNLNKNMQLHAEHKKQALDSFKEFMEATHTEQEARKTILNKTLDAVFHLPDFGYLKDDKSFESAQIIELIKNINSTK